MLSPNITSETIKSTETGEFKRMSSKITTTFKKKDIIQYKMYSINNFLFLQLKSGSNLYQFKVDLYFHLITNTRI